MIETKYVSKIRFREDTKANWASVNPILDSSEPGREIDTGLFKIGDGKTRWNALPYSSNTGAVIPEVPDDGKLYSRARTAGNVQGEWQEIIVPQPEKPEKPSIERLMGKLYGEELDCGYKYKFVNGVEKPVYGIKLHKNLNKLMDESITETLLTDVYSIVEFSGSIRVNDIVYTLPYNSIIGINNDTKAAFITLDIKEALVDSDLDIWLLYTKAGE